MTHKTRDTHETHTKNNNFLDYIPVRSVDWKLEENGGVCLIRPRTASRIIRWLIDRLKVSPWFYIHLDANGGAVWQAIDGERSIGAICHLLKKRPDLELPQPEQQVSMFVGMMHRNNFVRFRDPQRE